MYFKVLKQELLTLLFCASKYLWSWTENFSVSGNYKFCLKSSDLVPRPQGVVLGQTEHCWSITPARKVRQHDRWKPYEHIS